MNPFARRIRRLGQVLLLLSTALATTTALAGNNNGATASLSWANNSVVTNTASGPANNLFVRLSRATPMDFKGAEIDLVWNPVRSQDDLGCFERLGTFFQTSSTCSTSGYLNRGTNVPVTVNDDPNHYHVAWANTATSACTVGNAARVQFETDLCGDYGRTSEGCFVLNTCDLLDSNSNIDHITVVGSIVTVDGGGGFCDTNSPPVVQAIQDQSVEALMQLVVTPSGSDPDGDPLTWSGANIPSGASVNPATGVLTWTPMEAQVGVYPGVTLIAQDPDAAADSASFTITVTGPNQPPQFLEVQDYTVIAGTLVSFSVTANDPENDPLTYTTGPLPTGATFVQQSFDWTPTEAQIGEYDVLFIATDPDGAADSMTVHITVDPVPPPILAAYVDSSSACSPCDGTSWATAFHTIGEGLAAIPAHVNGVVQVARGTYREAQLTPAATTQVIGGYSSGGGSWDPYTNVTSIAAPAPRSASLLVLSGDSVHVEGFTVTGVNKGNAPVSITGRALTLRTMILTKNRVGNAEPVIAINAPASGVLLDQCIVARNLAGAATVGKGTIAIGPGADADIEDCSLTLDSTKTSGGTPGLYVEGAVTVRNTILWGLRPAATAPLALVGSGTADVSYSDVQGGWPGTGNISADPLFCGAKQGSYTISNQSPCLGAGHDGTTIGAYEIGCAKPSADDEEASAIGMAEDDPMVESAPVDLSLEVRPTLVRGSAQIDFALPQDARVTVEVFDATGVRVTTLVNEAMPAGRHVAQWNTTGRTIASGSYVVRLSTGSGTITRNVLVVR